MEALLTYAGDVSKELEEAEKLSVEAEGIFSLTAECGGAQTILCC